MSTSRAASAQVGGGQSGRLGAGQRGQCRFADPDARRPENLQIRTVQRHEATADLNPLGPLDVLLRTLDYAERGQYEQRLDEATIIDCVEGPCAMASFGSR